MIFDIIGRDNTEQHHVQPSYLLLCYPSRLNTRTYDEPSYYHVNSPILHPYTVVYCYIRELHLMQATNILHVVMNHEICNNKSIPEHRNVNHPMNMVDDVLSDTEPRD